MARLVVLRFENDNEAETFARQQLMGYRLWVGGGPAEVSIEMMVQTPTKFCECSNRNSEDFRRGEKRGWWVHNACGKPTVAWGENFRAVIGEAVDILELPSKNTDGRLRHMEVQSEE